jgi:hypothetical protein
VTYWRFELSSLLGVFCLVALTGGAGCSSKSAGRPDRNVPPDNLDGGGDGGSGGGGFGGRGGGGGAGGAGGMGTGGGGAGGPTTDARSGDGAAVPDGGAAGTGGTGDARPGDGAPVTDGRDAMPTPPAQDAAADGPGTGPPGRARVFISGHNLLDNPVPDGFAAMATSLGHNVAYNYQIIEGSPIRMRTKGDFGAMGWPGYSRGRNRMGSNMNVIDELKTPRTIGMGERYDTLVVTDRQDILEVLLWEDTVGFLRHFHDRLIDGNPMGRTFLHQAWIFIDRADPAPWIDNEKKSLVAWECAASKVNLTLMAEGRPDRVQTLPAAAAVADLLEKMIAGQVRGVTGTPAAKAALLFRNDIDLTPLGIYYVAAVHHAAILGRSPVGARRPDALNADTVADLQRIAWEFITAYNARPNTSSRSMDECRTHIAQNVCTPFWRLMRQPAKAADCMQTYANAPAERNPFRWPDPTLRLWPAP